MSGSGYDFQGAFERVHARLDDISKDTTASKTKLEALVGNGQPGEIHHIKTDISDLKEWKAKATGYLAAMSGTIATLGFVAHFVWDWARGKH